MNHRVTRVGFGFVLTAALAAAFMATGCNETDDPSDSAAGPGASPLDGDLHDDDAEGDDSTPPNDDPALGGDTPDQEPADDDTSAPATQDTSGPTGVATSALGRVGSPVPGKGVTYRFGVRNSRYAAGYHTGDDYAAPTGSKAVAVRSGTIRWSNDSGGAYGKWMGLDADNGRTYVYCHLSSRLVVSGKRVVAGQIIARTGATGNVTGPHLHFEDHPRGPFVYAKVRKPSW